MGSVFMQEVRNLRVTDYFLKYTINEIKIAYRILEYLEPDTVFKPKDLHNSVKDAFLNGNIEEAVIEIYEELGISIDSSCGQGKFLNDAIEFANTVYEDYKKRLNQDKLAERESLLKRLEEVNKELGLQE